MRYLPTVTEVIAPWVDFSRIAPDTLQAAADRGTAVHSACAMHAQGMWSFVTPPEIVGYVDSFRRWFDKMVGEVVLVEERLFDEANGFSGQLDLLVATKQGELWMPDLKTPMALSKSWRVQIAAYKFLAEISGNKPDRCGSLRLRRDGKIPAMDWYEGSAAQDFNIFLSALNCWRFFKG
jgi:hypothetical protein